MLYQPATDRHYARRLGNGLVRMVTLDTDVRIAAPASSNFGWDKAGHLHADEDAEHHDEQFHGHREPVLAAGVRDQSSEHVVPPAAGVPRAVARYYTWGHAPRTAVRSPWIAPRSRMAAERPGDDDG